MSKKVAEPKITAIILRGKRKGEVIELHQWCNDWATDSTGKVHSLGNLQFGLAAMSEIIKQFKLDREENTSKRLGQMFWFYYDFRRFSITGRFNQQKRDQL